MREYENQHGDRRVYDAEDGSDRPGEETRVNGDGPTGDAEADAVHENFGVIFDYSRRRSDAAPSTTTGRR